ncbi:MAG: conjugal transfer protein TraG N-terminal domain-containing protein, partial [Deferrisomatales bacterium]|nr:conjugal transfer protein TraG N-terminal domain-containing protein [Deferrisomatales bacterium]
MRARPGILCLVAVLGLTVFAEAALAVDLEYTTYNGFEAVTLAFRRIALIFAAGDFTKLFAIVCGAGILFAGVSHYARAFIGYHASPFAWAGPILVGVAIYLGLFASTGSLTVYDPVKNRFDRIDGIPDAIVLTAGALNKVERILVDVVDATAPAGVGYKDGAGGLGFYGVQETLQRGVKDTYLTQNLGEYVTKCLSFELVRPGTTLQIEDLVNNTTDFLPQLALAASPSVYCLYFDAAAPNGTALTCRDAWTELRAWFADPGNYAEDIRRAAANAGFDPTSAAELARYRSLVTNTLAEYAALAGITPERVSQQGTIARQLFEFVKEGAPSVAVSLQANKNLGTSLFGVGIVANEWIPVVRAVMTSVAVGMLPFLALFLPSPFFKRVLSLFLGLFVFLAAWGVTDAVAHSFALEYADQYFEMIRQSGLGLATWLNFPDVTTKTLALYGLIRMTGAVLASVIASTLVGFGGHALATLASHLTQPVQHQGASAGQAALTPEGRAHTLDTAGHAAVASRAWDNGGKHTFTNVVGAGLNARHSAMGSNLGYDGPEDAFATSFTGTRMHAGTVGGRAAGFGNTGYDVRAGSRRMARGSTIEGTAHHEARDAEGPLHGGRVGMERAGAMLGAARLGGEIRGVQAAGGPDRFRDAKAKAAASSTAHEGTLGPTPADAAKRARRRGETSYAGDESDFAWRDGHDVSDQEFGRRTGRLGAQRSFYGARAVTRTAGELGLTDDELLEHSTGTGAA